MKLCKALDDVEGFMHVCRNMRQADLNEVRATSFRDDVDHLADAWLGAIRHFPSPTGEPFAWVAHGPAGPTAIVGALQTWPGVWSCFMVATNNFGQIGLSLTKFIRRVMIPGLNRAGAHRAEARSSARHTEAHRWLEALGASREATLSGFGKAGEDFIVFRWGRSDVRQ